MEKGSEAIASCERIEAFLNLVDDKSNQTQNSSPNQSSSSIMPVSGDVQKGKGHYDAVQTSHEDDPNAEESLSSVGVGIELTSQINPNEENNNVKALNSGIILDMKKESYYYGDDVNSTTLKDIEFSVSKGELLIVVGSVGSGKSSLLSSILGEIKPVGMQCSSGCISIAEGKGKGARIAYCSQRAWILAATVRANIALAGEYEGNFKDPQNVDEDLYGLALESCKIVDDLLMWPAYDATEIGQRGISISGGQKARIALSRAVYSDADLYLLDDPLSACDAHVGKALFFNCIIDALTKRGKGVVLATHQLQYMKYADNILVLDSSGKQAFYGTYDQLVARSHEFPYLEIDKVTSNEINGAVVEVLSGEPSPDKILNKYDSSIRISRLSMGGESVNTRRTIVQAEDRAEGDISLSVIWSYLKAGGAVRGITALVLVFSSQGLLMISEYWPRWWAGEIYGNQSSILYILVYALLTVLCVLMGFTKAAAWFSFTLRASSQLHETCLWAVMHSPLQFFIANPTGRILNRFAKDQNQADELFPVTSFECLQSFMFCLGGVVLVCISIPWLILMIPFLVFAFSKAKYKYMCSAREVKRIDGLMRSPLYSDFSATIDGLSTLRAYSLQEKFTRLFEQEIDNNGRVYFSFLLINRWLGFRLDLMSALLLMGVSLLSVALVDTIDVGLIGFALAYTFALSGLFQLAVRQSADAENQMTSIERIYAYSVLPPEPGYSSNYNAYVSRQNTATISEDIEKTSSVKVVKGNVGLVDLTVTYRPDLDPVLKNLTVDIPSGSKVGICGRTGSGKSSTILALLRLNLVVGGDILIDGASLLQMDLETARSIISIIPQDPHLFSGTIRFNLDPFGIYSDEELWAALRDAHIYEHISKDPLGLGLQAVVEEGGKNFSVGQRQLLSMARAILRRCSIVLMDEVTASIDYVTDRLIQTTIRTSPHLKAATIITVAHRLRTIADSDMIVVINEGQIVEYDTPSKLLERDDSQFKSLVMESGEYQDIFDIANRINS